MSDPAASEPPPPPVPSRESVCQHALQLPCSPVLLPRLLAAIRDPASPADAIVSVIRMDTGLAGATLRLANSAFHAGSECETLEEAVFRLGTREIFQLATSIVALRWSEMPAAGYGWEIGDSFRFALSQAVAAGALARISRLVEPEIAYTAGLLQDLGKLAVALSCAPHFPRIRLCQESERCSWAEAERSILGYDHAEIGALLMERWQFPESLVTVAAFTYRPADGPPAEHPLLAVVHAARLVATHLGPGVGEDGFLYHVDGAFLERHGLTSVLLEETTLATAERLERLLGQSTTHGKIRFT